MNKRRQLYQLAKVVRKRAEIKAAKCQEFDSNLSGFCGRGSCILHDYLCRNGIKSQIVWSDHGHAFVIAEGYLVDVTATQFGKEKIMVRKIEQLKDKDWYWEYHKVFKTTNEFIKWQKEYGWAEYETGNKRDFIS